MIDYAQRTDGEAVKQRYLARIQELFANIKTWLADYPELQIEQSEVEIGEELTDYYLAPVLVVKTPTEQLAKIEPQGACIIDAEGRIDMLGWLTKEYIIYLVNGGPHLRGEQMFKEVTADGWYWLENNLKNRAHPMNKENFLKLFRQATDYEL